MPYYQLKGDALTTARAIGSAALGFIPGGGIISAGLGALGSVFGHHRRPCAPGEFYDMPCNKWPCYGCNEAVLAAGRQPVVEEPSYEDLGEEALPDEYLYEGEDDAATEF